MLNPHHRGFACFPNAVARASCPAAYGARLLWRAPQRGALSKIPGRKSSPCPAAFGTRRLRRSCSPARRPPFSRTARTRKLCPREYPRLTGTCGARRRRCPSALRLPLVPTVARMCEGGDARPEHHDKLLVFTSDAPPATRSRTFLRPAPAPVDRSSPPETGFRECL